MKLKNFRLENMMLSRLGKCVKSNIEPFRKSALLEYDAVLDGDYFLSSYESILEEVDVPIDSIFRAIFEPSTKEWIEL
jgi:DNA-binding protein Fis